MYLVDLPYEILCHIIAFDWLTLFHAKLVCKTFWDMNIIFDTITYSHRGRRIKFYKFIDKFVTIDAKFIKIFDILKLDPIYSESRFWTSQLLSLKKIIHFKNLSYIGLNKLCSRVVAVSNAFGFYDIVLINLNDQKHKQFCWDSSYPVVKLKFIHNFLIVIGVSNFDAYHYKVCLYHIDEQTEQYLDTFYFKLKFGYDQENLQWNIGKKNEILFIGLSNFTMSYTITINLKARIIHTYRERARIISITNDKVYFYDRKKLYSKYCFNTYKTRQNSAMLEQFNIHLNDFPVFVSENTIWFCYYCKQSRRYKLWCYLKKAKTKLYLFIKLKRFPTSLHYDEISNILSWKDSNKKISMSSIRTILMN